MNKRNIPNVNIVIGIVKKIKTGLIYMLSKERTTATIIAVVNLSIETPGSRQAVKNTASVVIKIFEINFIKKL